MILKLKSGGSAALSAHHGVQKIVSGGQTGVDRAALDVAIELGIAHGGWCPKGRLAEDGPIDITYQLQETDSADYAIRTEKNVIDSDGTLIIYRDELKRGTLLTNRLAKQHNRPLCRVRVGQVNLDRIVRWLHENAIRTLNVAGPRSSSDPTIAKATRDLLKKVFAATPHLPEQKAD